VYARSHFGCSALRSLRSANLKYIDAPKPELYDLATDPAEQKNLYDQQRSKAANLRERLIAIRGTAPTPAAKPPTPETITALRSLGYLSGGSSHMDSHIDPKDRIADFERYLSALNNESTSILQKLAVALPDVVDIKMSLGMNQLRLKNESAAANEFKHVLALDPSNAAAHFELGLIYFRQHQLDPAVNEFKATLSLEPWYTRADEALAEIYLQQKDFPPAREHLNHLLSIDPDSYTAHFNLGIFAAMAGEWPEAERQLRAALHADPNSQEAHKTLAMILQQEGKQ
jgi:Tfp pilus assembly protein PilF